MGRQLARLSTGRVHCAESVPEFSSGDGSTCLVATTVFGPVRGYHGHKLPTGYEGAVGDVCSVVGAESMPSWAGDECIADMSRRVSLRARLCLNPINHTI